MKLNKDKIAKLKEKYKELLNTHHTFNKVADTEVKYSDNSDVDNTTSDLSVSQSETSQLETSQSTEPISQSSESHFPDYGLNGENGVVRKITTSSSPYTMYVGNVNNANYEHDKDGNIVLVSKIRD